MTGSPGPSTTWTCATCAAPTTGSCPPATRRRDAARSRHARRPGARDAPAGRAAPSSARSAGRLRPRRGRRHAPRWTAARAAARLPRRRSGAARRPARRPTSGVRPRTTTSAATGSCTWPSGRTRGRSFTVERIERGDPGADGTARVTVTGHIPAGDSPLTLTYTLAPDGTLEVGERLDPVEGADLPRLPRFGMRTGCRRATIAPSGSGADRWSRTGTARRRRSWGAGRSTWPSGRTPTSVRRRPATAPTCAGSSSGRRGLGAAGGGRAAPGGHGDPLRPRGPRPRPAKAQRHWGELRPRDAVYLNVDFRQMGVGGIDSWGPTALPEYSLPYGRVRVSVQARGP